MSSTTRKPESPVHSRLQDAAALETWSRSLDLRSLTNEHGTPLYLINVNQVCQNFARYLGVVQHPSHVRYPVKANSAAEILELVAALGGGADCASRDEVWAALGAGVPMGAVTYNSPAPDVDLAVWLLRSGATVVADSMALLAEIGEQLSMSELAGRIFVRVNPGDLPGYREASDIHRYTAHAGNDSAFGIPSELLPAALDDHPLPITGLHMHVGTQMDNLEAFMAAVGFLHDMTDILETRTSHRIATLNLGGGLGIPFRAGDRFPSIDGLVNALRPLKREGIAYEVEPGNSLVGNAVALLARVVAVKTIRGRRWGVLDVGTDQLVKFTIARWEHQIVDAEHEPLPTEGPDALVGPLCFAGDVLLPATRLDGVERGDPVLIRHAGAYCEAVSSRFNGRRGPAHLLIEPDGTTRLVRRAEDPFFQPRVQAHMPGLWTSTDDAASGGETGNADHEERIDRHTVRALQSRYMHEQAEAEGYTIHDAHRIGEREYRFEVEPTTTVGFVAMPLALRIAGDASIIAIGHVRGWRSKAGPVWATRLTLTCGSMLPSDGPFICRVVVGAPVPAWGSAGGSVAVVHFELGSGGVAGTARVVVPEESAADAVG